MEWRAISGGVMVLGATGLSVQEDWRELYAPVDETLRATRQALLAVPYFASANRGPTDMVVWVADGP